MNDLAKRLEKDLERGDQEIQNLFVDLTRALNDDYWKTSREAPPCPR